jgi:hypothetical protein
MNGTHGDLAALVVVSTRGEVTIEFFPFLTG